MPCVLAPAGVCRAGLARAGTGQTSPAGHLPLKASRMWNPRVEPTAPAVAPDLPEPARAHEGLIASHGEASWPTESLFEDAPAHVDLWDWLIRAAIVLGVVLLGVVSLTSRFFVPLIHAAEHERWMRAVEHPSMLWAAMGSVLLGFRTFLWFRYRPHRPATMADAPRLTVIIPAYNEGPMVAKSIDSVAQARYPRERLEIFVVDDGSTDDTWRYIQRAAKRHPGLVTALRFPGNRGKRAGLEAGFRQGKGDVFVTIDSDSVIDPETLLAVTGPFRDPKVGAVAGRVAVYNRKGFIPRMLHVRFALTFDYLRAVQSTYGTVYCCPGALAGYRASVVRDVLDAWVTQRFFGRSCTFGEDRAMTNSILDQGFDTVYQRTAVVHTIVPTTYKRVCKMFLRWDRSYVREEIRFARSIVWKRPLKKRLMALFDSVVMNLRYPVGWVSLVLIIVLSFKDPFTLVRFLAAVGVFSLFNMLYYLRTERSFDFVFGVFYSYFSIAALFWVFPYACLTPRAQGWLTR